jgi:Carboxypeptidase regulatory-like domain
MNRFFLVFLFSICLSANIEAQVATLQGKVTEAKTGDEAINAYIKLLQNGVQKTLVATDFEGNYSLFVAEDGVYDVEVSYVGMATQLTRGVVLKKGEITKLDAKLETNTIFETLEMRIFCPRIIQQDDTTSGATYTSEQISRSPR